MNIFLMILLSSLSHLSFAIPEENFRETWDRVVLPYYQSLNKGSFKNFQGKTIKFSYLTHPSNKKALVILPGRTEPAIKYAEFIYDFTPGEYDVFIMDHQGQGESFRWLKDTQRGHVLKFSDYVKDLKQFISKEVLTRTKKPLYLIAHSMGGAISVHYMNKNPNVFKKAVLMAPMLEMNTSPYNESVAMIYSSFLRSIGRGTYYAPTTGPYDAQRDRFEANLVTQSKARFEVSKYLFTSEPSLVVAGPTVRWVNESLKATKSIHKLSVSTPILLFQAEKDLIVKPSRQTAFCQNNNCTLTHVKDAYHELLMEKDLYRDPVIQEIKDFLDP